MFKTFSEDGLDDSDGESRFICFQFVIFRKLITSFTIITSIVIIIYNGFFYSSASPMVSKIGYHLKTEEVSLISFSVFVCLCVDMIAIPIILGMNTTEYYDSKFTNTLFSGKHTDIGAEWYRDTGRQFISTIILFAF